MKTKTKQSKGTTLQEGMDALKEFTGVKVSEAQMMLIIDAQQKTIQSLKDQLKKARKENEILRENYSDAMKVFSDEDTECDCCRIALRVMADGFKRFEETSEATE